MIDTGPFEALAEFGVALAVARSEDDDDAGEAGQLLEVDRFRVYNALVCSLGGAFFALVPLGLQLAELALEDDGVGLGQLHLALAQ